MSVKLNAKGSGNATKLVNAGKVTKGEGWSAPSAESENNYINKNGIGEYARWFLGIDSEASSDTKGHYKYSFSNNWKTVSRAGIIAVEKRAAQQGATDIENKAKSLLAKIDGKSKASFFDINGETFYLRSRKKTRIIIAER